MNVLGYYEDDSKNPIGYINGSGIVIFSNRKDLLQFKKLGGINELHNILSNIDYYTRVKSGNIINQQYSHEKASNMSSGNLQSGSGGFFGESSGKCGWGDFPSCCFYDCSPLWKTNLWPFNITM